MTPWAEFKESDTAKLLQTMRTKLIIDPLKVLAGKLKDAQLNYVTLGKT
jgi:hypothetical protein